MACGRCGHRAREHRPAPERHLATPNDGTILVPWARTACEGLTNSGNPPGVFSPGSCDCPNYTVDGAE